MEHFYAIAQKILFIILLIGTGVFAKKMRWISDAGEKDLSRVSVNFIFPAMLFSSIITTLSVEDVLSNLLLPALSLLIHFTGFVVGYVICRLAGYTGDRRKIFLLHATLNNFFAMALPFALFFFPGKGAALLAVANLGSTIVMWTAGVMLLVGNVSPRETVRNVFSPAMLAIVAGIFCVLSGFSRFIPRLVIDVIVTLGEPTLFLGLFIAGTQIYKLGRKALRFNGWNILVGLSRNILIPAILFAFAFLLRNAISKESLVIFMIVSITPANVTTISLALKFDAPAELAAEGVVFTHALGIVTMIGFIMLIEKFLL